jgi:hypothetical protein
VDPVPDPLLFFSGSAGNRTRVNKLISVIIIAQREASGIDKVKKYYKKAPKREGHKYSSVTVHRISHVC